LIGGLTVARAAGSDAVAAQIAEASKSAALATLGVARA